VLEHVDAEKLERDGVDRRRERRDERGEPEEEEERAPDRPRPASAGTADVDDRGQEREGDKD
jgi:hypothetical protein